MTERIIILGAGFGGLSCAKKLEHIAPPDTEILLIDRNDYHLYTPTLYEIATTSETDAGNMQLKKIVAFPTANLFRRVKFQQAEITAIDLKNREVQIRASEKNNLVSFDYLVIALGSEVNFFNTPGAEQFSMPLKNFYHALKIRDTIEGAVQILKHSTEKKPYLDIAIVGGGSAGVETAGEIAKWTYHLEKRYHKKFCRAVTILEAGESILAAFPKPVIAKAKARLSRLGIRVVEKSPVSAVEEKNVLLADGSRIPSDITLWTAGIAMPRLLNTLGMKTERRGRIETDATLACLPSDEHLDIHEKIYIIGDISCSYHPATRLPAPQVARIAIEQGKTAAHNIAADLAGRQKKIFTFSDYPYVLPIGGRWAIAFYKNFVLAGFFAWIFKGIIELYYLVSILGARRAVAIWLFGLRIFMKND